MNVSPSQPESFSISLYSAKYRWMSQDKWLCFSQELGGGMFIKSYNL